MTPVSAEEPDSRHTSFTLIEDKIFKDQVSLEVHFNSDHDEVTLKVFSSHLEVNFFPSLSDERDSSVGEACSNVRQVIETSILRSLEDLHYNRVSVKPVMCFRCDHCSELHQVEKMKGKNYHRMYCSKAHTNSPIPPEGRCWFNEGQCDVLGYHFAFMSVGCIYLQCLTVLPFYPPPPPTRETLRVVSDLSTHHSYNI
jgi:hypothetical protein